MSAGSTDRWARFVLAVLVVGALGGGLSFLIQRASVPKSEHALPPALIEVPQQPSTPSAVAPEPASLASDVGLDASRDVEMGGSGGSTGCGVQQKPGTRRQSFGAIGDYLVHVPRGYQPDRPSPVVIVLYAERMRSAAAFLRMAGLTDLADKHGILLLAPNYDGAAGIRRVDFVIEAYRDAATRVCMDPTRIFAVGHGGGGRVARDLRCAMPLSGIATMGSGQNPDENVCQSESPIPFLRFYGTNDLRVPAGGGKGCFSGPFLSAGKIEAEWAARNECRGRPEGFARKGKSQCRIWDCEAAVATCALDGGHDWPGAAARVQVPGCDTAPADFPMVATMWSFFEDHGVSLRE